MFESRRTSSSEFTSFPAYGSEDEEFDEFSEREVSSVAHRVPVRSPEDAVGMEARRVRVGSEESADFRAQGVATGVFRGSGARVVLDSVQDKPFDESDLSQYLAGEPTLYFSTKSDGTGLSRSVDLTKKSEDKDSKERVPDDGRQAKQKLTFAKLKHTLGLSKEYVVTRFSLKSGEIEIQRADGKFIGKYNLNDLGALEPHGAIHGGGGLKQLFRDTSYTEYQKGDLEAKMATVNKLKKELIENVKQETGPKLSGQYISENKGNAQGHQAFHTAMSDGAKKVVYGEKWMPSAEAFEAFGYMDRTVRRGRSDLFSLNAHGQKPYNEIYQAMQLREILKHDLERALQAKSSERSKLHPGIAEDAEAIKQVNAEINALKKAYDELDQTLPSSVTFPILLLNKTFKMKVYDMNTRGEFNRNPDGSPKVVEREVKGSDLLKPIPEDKYTFYGIRPGDHQEAAYIHNNHVELFARHGEAILGSMIDKGNTRRTFPNFWNRTTDINPADQQVKTDMGGVVLQAVSFPSSDPTMSRLISYAEDHDEGRKVAQESRMADLIVHTVLRDRTPNPEYALRGYNREPEIVRNVIAGSLREYQAVRAVQATDRRNIIGKFRAKDLQEDIGPKFAQRAWESLQPYRSV